MSVVDLPPPAAAGGGDMADDFTGTQTEKTDKLIAAVVEIRSTLRLWGRIASFVLPSLVAFFGYVVVSLQSTSTRLDRLADRVEFNEKLTSQRLDSLDKRLDSVEKQLRETNDRLSRIDEKLGQLLARKP